MKKFKALAGITTAVLVSSIFVTPAFALDWRDGALKSWEFTYVDGGEGIESVTVSDTNNTANGEVAEGSTVVTKTGTIIWRDSYKNVTTFTVDVKDGYEVSKVIENGREGDFEKTDDGVIFKFTREGAEFWGIDGKDVDFSIETEKIAYTFVDEEGNTLGTAKLGDEIDFEAPEKEGYTFLGWKHGYEVVTEFTEDMIPLDGTTITLSPAYEINKYDIKVNYYNNNTLGEYGGYIHGDKPLTVDYGTVIDSVYLRDVLGCLEYDIVGFDSVTVGADTKEINLVNTVPVEKGSYEYGFTYIGKDSGIKSVKFSVDNGEEKNIELNEKIVVNTEGIETFKTIKFTVEVEDGKELVLKASGSENRVTENEDGTYSFGFVRDGSKNDFGSSEDRDITINLFTQNK